METNPDEKFRYDCPFLVNNSCSVYAFRGLICRCFGLMTFQSDKNTNLQAPFCAYQGLNYSNVLDTETHSISEEKFKENGFQAEPKAFNSGYASLIDDDFGTGFDFEFGDVKPMIDWFEKFSM